MAVSFVLPERHAAVSDDQLVAAWRAVIARHQTLRTAFSYNESGELVLQEHVLGEGVWREHGDLPGDVRSRLRTVLDQACQPFNQPSHLLCMVTPQQGSPVVIMGSDHSHIDAWSLLVIVRDITTVLDDLAAGRPAGADLPEAAAFAEHTAALEERPPAPEDIQGRWHEIIEAGGGFMPAFPLPLGDVSIAQAEVVVLHDVLNAEELSRYEQAARDQGVRMIALAVSAMTRVTLDLAGAPLRAVLPVHSRHDTRWHGSVGWFITNSVLECAIDDVTDCSEAVGEAIQLGSYPLAPIMAPYGGMPQGPGMFALSWLDNRRLPVAVEDGLKPQHVSAVIRTDGVMIWFVVNRDGLHVRCRYPDTPTARENVERWLQAVCSQVRATVDEADGADEAVVSVD